MTIRIAYRRFGHCGAPLQVSLSCPLIVVLSPSLFHHRRCPRSTLRAVAHSGGFWCHGLVVSVVVLGAGLNSSSPSSLLSGEGGGGLSA